MSPRRFLTDRDRYPWRALKIIALAVAVLLTAVCGGGGGWTPHTPRLPPPPPPDLSVSILAMPVSLSPDGVRVASIRTYSGILISDWQARSHPLILDDRSCLSGTDVIRFSPDGSLLAHTCQDDSVLVWETNTGRPAFRLPCGPGIGTSIAWSHDGHRLAAACKGRIIVWEVSTGKKVSDFTGMEKSGRITG